MAGAGVNVLSSLNPSGYSQSVTLTATISGAYGLVKGRNGRAKPQDVTGTVTWSDNTGCGSTPVTTGNSGVATCTTTTLPAGTDTITATYSGDSNHNGGTGTLSGGQGVSQASQPVMLAFHPVTVLTNGAASGDTFTVTATGGASGNSVNFAASGACGIISVVNETATYVMTGGPGSTGTCTVNATQVGNNNYSAGSATQAVKEVKKVALTVPTTSISTTAQNSSAPYKSQFTVTATTNASTTATITVSPSSVCTISGNTSGRIVTMNSGTGTCTVTAKWKADEYYSAATESTSVSAAKLASTITWTPPTSITYGTLGSILNATTTGSDGTTLTVGTYAYSATPNGGSSEKVMANTVLPVGTYTLAVTFTPTGTEGKDYAAPAEATAPLTATQGATTTRITSATASTSHPLNVTVDFSVAGVSGSKQTGTVGVSDSAGNNTCSGSLAANGTGHCTITFIGVSGASVTLTATYQGDANNAGSVSASYSTTD